jgi:hypothetical protein
MGTRSGDIIGSAGLCAVLRRFPEKQALVKRKFTLDESFRAMCDDLEAAEGALSVVDRLPDHLRVTRRAEYDEVIQSLVDEIEAALHRAKIIPIA